VFDVGFKLCYHMHSGTVIFPVLTWWNFASSTKCYQYL